MWIEILFFSLFFFLLLLFLTKIKYRKLDTMTRLYRNVDLYTRSLK